jgi:hypothetical protein
MDITVLFISQGIIMLSELECKKKFRVQGSKVQGSEVQRFRVQRFRVQRFRVQGSGLNRFQVSGVRCQGK